VETGCRGGQGSPRAVVLSGRQYSLTLKMKVTCSSEMSVDSQHST
jgi:hypothetical protein